MPLLAGLFSRKHKSKRDDRSSISDLDSPQSSPTTATYVVPPNSVPSYPNAASLLHPNTARQKFQKNIRAPPMSSTPSPSNGSKLRNPFARKRSTPPESTSTGDFPSDHSSKNFNTSPRPSPPIRPTLDTEPQDLRRLKPPPSRSAIFAAYGDPQNALSTRSLPTEPNSLSLDSSSSLKRPSIFTWAKPSSSAATSSQTSVDFPSSSVNASSGSPTTPDNHSFNLKSFRHICAPSPTSNASNVSLPPPPIPRPRGESVNSDSSQRISVAAFREAQARRSAGSPSPSIRSPSPGSGFSHTPAQGRGSSNPRPSRSTPNIPQGNRQQQPRRPSMAMNFTSESDASSFTDNSEDETVQPGNWNRREAGRAKAKSEAGHSRPFDLARKDVYTHRSPKSVGHSMPTSAPQPENLKKSSDIPRSQSSTDHFNGGIRQRASASASALTPSAAAKRASILAAANANLNSGSSSNLEVKSTLSRYRRPSESSQRKSSALSHGHGSTAHTSNDSSASDSDDDAPLASLIGPKRPGSAMSSYSNLHSRSAGSVAMRSNHKPLIDINDLTGPKRSINLSTEKNSAGFTQGPTLLSQSAATASVYSHSPLIESPISTIFNVNDSDEGSSSKTSTKLSPRGASSNGYLHPSTNRSPRTKSDLKTSTSIPETPLEHQRDPISDRLTRIVKNSLPSPEFQHNATGNALPSKRVSTSPSDVLEASSSKQDVVPAPAPMLRARPELLLTEDHSPVDEELAQLLGAAGIKFIFRNGEMPESSSDSDSDCETSDKLGSEDRIAPIPIKKRSPPPAFAVTSRPPLTKHDSPNAKPPVSSLRRQVSDLAPATRPRSSTLTNSPASSSPSDTRKPAGDSVSTAAGQIPSSSNTSSAGNSTTSHQAKIERSNQLKPPGGARHRTSTMLTGVPLSAQMPKSFNVPQKPFAPRRNSPASSTGDSSSGRAPLTPQDGSEVGTHQERKQKKHVQRRSVSFEDDVQSLKPPNRNHSSRSGSEAGDTSDNAKREHKRRERRRTEAKAAIELGNVINGPGPVVDDDDLPVNQTVNPRMSALNPMMAMSNPMTMPMGFGASPNPAGWPVNLGQQMTSPHYLAPPSAESNFLAAHQQAMLIAKQAYQMAVAQQAMAAAADEWERGSAVGGFGGGGSVYGGPAAPLIPSQFGMMGVMPGTAWPAYGLPRSSMFGGNSFGLGDGGMISSSRSEYGGINPRIPANNWSSSRSSYGENFGPSSDQYRKGIPTTNPRNNPRQSAYLPAVPPIPASQSTSGRSSPDSRTSPRSRTTSQPASPSRTVRRVPPSSWKPGM